jgi:hypothetical protein
MDSVAYHPLPELFLPDYQSLPGRNCANILLFKIVSVNLYLRTSKRSNHIAAKLARFTRLGTAPVLVLLRSSSEGPLNFPTPLSGGMAKTALYCAHRATIIHLIDPSKLACHLSQGSLVDPRMRASNEHILIVRIPRAERAPGRFPSKPARFTFPGTAPVLALLRPSSEALLRARAPGAKDHTGTVPLSPLSLPNMVR